MSTQRKGIPKTVLVSELVENIKSNLYKNIIVMCGAGLSVSAGIPDFRSPNTGVYANLQEYNLPSPEHLFRLDYFQQTKGKPFYSFSHNLFPDSYNPSIGHYFIRLLQEKHILLRCYTQNIDTLERKAGIEEKNVVEAHGSFAAASCTRCKASFPVSTLKSLIKEKKFPVHCKEKGCKGLVKPDIVFFGEQLPKKFYLSIKSDFRKCDLLIIMGTSLQVRPFADLINLVSPSVNRVLINRDAVGVRPLSELTINVKKRKSSGLKLYQNDNERDIFLKGDIDDIVSGLCDRLGWTSKMHELCDHEMNNLDFDVEQRFDTGHSKLDADWPSVLRAEAVKKEKENEMDSLVSRFNILGLGSHPKNSTKELTQKMQLKDGTQSVLLFNERYGSLSGLFYINEEKLTVFDEDDVLVLVKKEADGVDYNKPDLFISCHTLYYEQEIRIAGRSRICFPFSLDLRGNKVEELEIWYISNETGKVFERFSLHLTEN
eukprot:snap_masked-scaffold_36-processed-gene-0.38-mRNA-1 protein AED:0.16 eAED:0.16 QI:0/-1/0/1/-1/1/1/0/486